jgi:hypothetical protein
MTSGEQAEAKPALMFTLGPAHIRATAATGLDFSRETLGGVFVPPGFPAPDRQRGARLLLLAAGLGVAMLASLAMWIFHGQLGVDHVTAARVAMIMTVGALAVFLWSLYRVIVVGAEKMPDLRPLFAPGAPTVDEFFQSLSSQQSRLSTSLLILIHMGWIMPLTGALIAILGQTGTLRVTGLATGTSLGALTVFIRSTVQPAHRENLQMIEKLLNKYSPRPKKTK